MQSDSVIKQKILLDWHHSPRFLNLAKQIANDEMSFPRLKQQNGHFVYPYFALYYIRMQTLPVRKQECESAVQAPLVGYGQC